MGVADSEAAAFSRKLAALKREGCNVLVVNDPGGERAACERLLGGHDLDRRHVFVPTTVSVAEVLDRHGTRSRDAGRFGVVDATDASTTRSAAAAASTGTAGPTIDGASDPEWYDEVADLTDLETLFATVHEHIERVVAGDRGAPGELRFCLDSIDPFFDAVPEETLFRFVHLLTSAIRDARGMGHFHTSAGAHDVTVATLEPLFDATVYVESQPDGTVEQRWVLTESGLSTDWFELD